MYNNIITSVHNVPMWPRSGLDNIFSVGLPAVPPRARETNENADIPRFKRNINTRNGQNSELSHFLIIATYYVEKYFINRNSGSVQYVQYINTKE